MADKNLGRLEQVPLRDIWTSEAREFTPWLAKEENLTLLGETIGIELELEAQEQDVGPFRADILCKDTATDHWVLIENQLERTDHMHLGQLMTYAAGLKAVSIVWVAERFSEEHRAALDWLNEITDDRFCFFGLEVELWRIGDSPVAPKFNLVSKPNEWSKRVESGMAAVEKESLTASRMLQLEFWIGFREFVRERGSKIKPTKPQPRHWMQMSIGRSGFNLHAIASSFNSVEGTFDSHEIRAEFGIDNPDSKAYFSLLQEASEALEKEVGEPLVWHNPPQKRQCRIYLRRDADLEDRARWPEYFGWLVEKLEKLHAAFSERVKHLEIEENQPAE